MTKYFLPMSINTEQTQPTFDSRRKARYSAFSLALLAVALAVTAFSEGSSEPATLAELLLLCGLSSFFYLMAFRGGASGVFMVSAPLYAGVFLFGPHGLAWLSLGPSLLSFVRRRILTHAIVNYSMIYICFSMGWFAYRLSWPVVGQEWEAIAVAIAAVVTHALNWIIRGIALRLYSGGPADGVNEALRSLPYEIAFAIAGWIFARLWASGMQGEALALSVFLMAVQYSLASLKRREELLLRCSTQIEDLVKSLHSGSIESIGLERLPAHLARLACSIAGAKYEARVDHDTSGRPERLRLHTAGNPGEEQLLFLSVASELSSFTLAQVRLRDEIMMREQQLRAVLDASPSAVVLLGPDGRVRLLSREAEALFSVAPDRLYDLSREQFRDLWALKCGDRAMLDTLDKTLKLSEGRLMAKEVNLGSRVYRWYAIPVMSKNGVSVGSVSVFTDVTESIESEARLKESYESAVRSLASAVDARDPYTHGHSERVSHLAASIARVMALPESLVETVRFSGMLHDIGKIAFPDSILTKHGTLDDKDMEIVRSHPLRGSQITRLLPDVSSVILYHHERFDGTGYARGLKGDQIPLGARIVAVADAFDAMTQDRPYRKSLGTKGAISELLMHSGTQFDPRVVQALLRALDEGIVRARPHSAENGSEHEE